MPTENASSDAARDSDERKRRPRGEPRRLLIKAAQDVFNAKGYASTSMREVAETAAVSEALIFRYFGSKAGLFQEAIVEPFVDLVDHEIETRLANPNRYAEARQESRKFIGEMYDMFTAHRALAALLFAVDALTESELSESGVLAEVRSAVGRLVAFGTEEALAQGAAVPASTHDLSTISTMAMVAGMATFGAWYYGAAHPKRDLVLDELTEWVLVRYLPQTAN